MSTFFKLEAHIIPESTHTPWKEDLVTGVFRGFSENALTIKFLKKELLHELPDYSRMFIKCTNLIACWLLKPVSQTLNEICNSYKHRSVSKFVAHHMKRNYRD